MLASLVAAATTVLMAVTIAVATPVHLPMREIARPDASVECVPYDELITSAVMTSAVSYLADNPRGENAPISRADVEPFTPTELFRVFYRGKASAVEFKKSLLTFVKAKYLRDGKVDRVQFRANIYKTARAGSLELSREIMAHLLLMIVSDYTDQTWYWKKFRCVPRHGRKAAEMAVTIELARLRNEIGETNYGQFLDLGVGTTLAFVIDDTGSMSGEISAAKKRVERITDHLRNSTDQPQEYVLVPFNDPFVADVTNTRSAGQFKRSLARLYAHGGGDMPEMAMAGIQLAIENCRPGSTIYVITDASAKDYEQQDSVIARAIEKQIVIIFMLTNDLNRAHCRDQQSGSSPSSPTMSGNFRTCLSLYQHIADETGGRVLIIDKSEIFRATEIIQSGLKQGLVVLKRQLVDGSASSASTSAQRRRQHHRDIGFLFDVDPSITEIVVEASGDCGVLNLTNANGHVNEQLKHVGDSYTASVKLDDNRQPPGKWAVMSDIDDANARDAAEVGSCEIKASGKSTTGFVLTTVVKHKTEPDTSYRVLNGLPSVDNSVGFLVDIYGMNHIDSSDPNQRVERVRFINEKGRDVIGSLPTVGGDQNVIRVNKTSLQFYMPEGLPRSVEPFYMVLEGRYQGKHFSRVSNRLLQVSHVTVSCDIEDVVFRAGGETFFNFAVTNNGAREDNFTLTVSDDKGFASLNGTSTDQRIRARATRHFAIRVNIPEGQKEGSASKITISAKGWRPGSFQYHVCTVVLGQNKRPKVESFHIRGTISSRFAETVVRSTVVNDAEVARDAQFEVMLPAEAFISNLTMEIGSQVVVGSVEEKVRAEKIFKKAKKLGKAAAHVAVRDHSTQVYRTNLLVPPRTTVIFQLTYQQLLKRIRGMYEYSLVIDPDQPVKHLTVDVNILESSPIKFVSVPGFKTEQTNRRSFDIADGLGKFVQRPVETPESGDSTSITFNHDRHGCHVRYAPSLTTQTAHSPLGMSGTYTVQFDVSRTQQSGKSVVAGGYFAHFFSAPFLPNPPKMLTFVIDVSGSMLGHKMTQVKQALRTAIASLQPEDYFNLVFFNNRPKAWIPSVMAPVKDIDVDEALEYISKYEPEGGTNIGGAFDLAFDLMTPYLPPTDAEDNEDEETNEEEIPWDPIPEAYDGRTSDDDGGDAEVSLDDYSDEFTDMRRRSRRSLRKRAESEAVAEHSKMIVFLTDGVPTEGNDGEDLLSSVREFNKQRVAIHAIGFGTLVDMDFLKKLSGQNGGVSRRVFENLDAAIQIHNFIEEVVTPVMKNVTISFENDKVEDLTSNRVRTIFEGSEIIVAGKILADAFDAADRDGNATESGRSPRSIRGQVRGKSMNNEVAIDFDIDASNTYEDQADQPEEDRIFTERLWSYLRIKEILDEAALAENKTLKSKLKQQALNMSLSYNFVTPVTSLVALKRDDLKDISDALDKDKEAASGAALADDLDAIAELEHRLAETKERILTELPIAPVSEEDDEEVEEEEYVAYDDYGEYGDYEEYEDVYGDDHVVLSASEPSFLMTSESSRSASSAAGFYGDPHFVIPLAEDFSLCFNWNGRSGEVYNLLHDPRTGLIVNGELTNSPPPPVARSSSDRDTDEEDEESLHTYVSSLAFNFVENPLLVLVRPDNATLIAGNGARYHLPLNSVSSLTMAGVRVEVAVSRHSLITLYVVAPHITFKIIVHRRRRTSPYLDFSVAETTGERRFDGIIGQFVNCGATYSREDVDSPDTELTTAVINGKVAQLRSQTRRNPSTLEHVRCWQAADYAAPLTTYPRQQYLVDEPRDGLPRQLERTLARPPRYMALEISK